MSILRGASSLLIPEKPPDFHLHSPGSGLRSHPQWRPRVLLVLLAVAEVGPP